MKQKADNYIGLLNMEMFKPVGWEEQAKIAKANMDLCDEAITKIKKIIKKVS